MNKKQIHKQQRIQMGQVLQQQAEQKKLSKQSYKLLQTYQSLQKSSPSISIYSCMTPLISSTIFSKPLSSPPQLNQYCQSYLSNLTNKRVDCSPIVNQENQVEEDDGFQIGDGEDKVEEMVSLGFKYVGSLFSSLKINNRK